jgi:hypothetical protein
MFRNNYIKLQNKFTEKYPFLFDEVPIHIIEEETRRHHVLAHLYIISLCSDP